MCSKAQAPDFKKRFQHLAESDMNSDCEFIVGPQKTLIKGHKVIFCTASEVFQAMFFGNLKEEKPVRIEDLDPDGFKGMKAFIYTGEVSFRSAFHALSTYIAARKYMIADLRAECVKYIENQIQPPDVLEFLDRCLTNVITEFNGLCCKIIQEKTDEVLASEYFVSASTQTIEFILQSPSLKLNSEMELFGHFERWALAEVERQKIPAGRVSVSFNDLKKHLRFLTISSDEFVSRVAPSPLLTQAEKYAISLNKMKFDSKLTSETISMTLQPRNFNTLLSNSEDQHQQKHMFEIIITNQNQNIHATHSHSRTITIHGCKPIIRGTPKPEINLLPKRTSGNALNGHSENKLLFQWSIFDEHISFEAKRHLKNLHSRELVIIKTKFRLLSVNKCDDLFFENESSYIFDYNGNYSEYQGNAVLAVIPISVLENGPFYRYKMYIEDYINVEGTFDVRVMKL